MSDIVKDATDYRIKQIEIAEEKYYKTLIATLDRIEREVVELANRDLKKTTDGRLIELQAAIAIRPKIKAILDREYLAWSDTVVREGFTKQAKRVEKAFKRIGNIPLEFQELTKGDLALVQNLKQQYFTQFKDVSNTFTRRLSEKVYQNTLVGNSFVELEKELKQTINGIYASSNDAEANRLIDFINKARQELLLKEAVLLAARRRLRAISLTTATTVLGLLPVVLGFMGTSVIWQPMAVAVCFGIVSATSLTLFLVPCLYLVLEQLKEVLKNTKNNKDGLYKGL